MATVRLNDTGSSKASDLIADGKVEQSASWSFSAEDGNAILGDDPQADDWARYGSFHLGIRTGADRLTKDAYAYPFGKEGKIDRAALRAIRSRAAQQGHTAVFEEAGRLLAKFEKSENDFSVDEKLASFGARSFTSDMSIVPLDDLPQAVIQLLPLTGDTPVTAVDGRKILVTRRSIESVIAQFQSMERDMSIDYSHGALNPEILLGELASGWIEELWPVYSEADIESLADEKVKDAILRFGGSPGLYAKIRLTEKAAQHVRDREFRYISPVVFEDKETTEVIGILNAALTNNSALGDLMPIAARRKPIIANPDDDDTRNDNPGSQPKTKGSEMDWKILAADFGIEAATEDEFRAKLLARRTDFANAEARALKAEASEKALREAGEKAALSAKLDKAIAEKLILEDQRKFWEGQSTGMLDAFLATAKPYTAQEDEKPPQGKMIDREEDGSKAESTGLIKLHVGDKVLGVKPRPIQTEEAEKKLTELRARHGGDMAKALRNQARRVVGG